MQLESASAIDGLKASIAGYLRPADVARIEEAYRFSEAAHRGQFRQSGEAYIHHPIAVAERDRARGDRLARRAVDRQRRASGSDQLS